MSKPVILTGLRANNDLHIGNYFGALLPLIDQIKKDSGDYQINLFVPDLHSITTPIEYGQLQKNIMNNLKVFTASGLPLDSEDVKLYRQSYIPAHSEMTIILNDFTGMGEMGRMTQYKDKSQKIGDDRVSVGLFDYPVMMAADILLYGAEYVPVGDDQSQHLEFTRDIAERINQKFGNIFTIPKPVEDQHKFFQKDQGLRIKDLADPSKKMSKSDESDKGIIFLSDDPESAKKKIMSATTDSINKVSFDPKNQPGVSNLIHIYALIKGISPEEAAKEFAGETQYGAFKQKVADSVGAFLAEFQDRFAETSEQDITEKLLKSEQEMNKVAGNTLSRLQKVLGLR
jgi:tryptophanyl-tRNA synthetase